MRATDISHSSAQPGPSSEDAVDGLALVAS